MKQRIPRACVGATALLLMAHSATAGGLLNLAPYPLFLSDNAAPNILVIYDNSESMDGTMAGKLIAGDDPTTRANTARRVITGTINNYRMQFNWGLETFALADGPWLLSTYAYYFGGDGTDPTTPEVQFTNDCVNGISASNGGVRCVANPQGGLPWAYVTYARTGDDPDVNDVLYAWPGFPPWGMGVNNSTAYYVFYTRNGATNPTSWDWPDFSGYIGALGFTPTDAGFLPGTPPYPRLYWIPRAWGFYSDVSGNGAIVEPVKVDSGSSTDPHYNALMTALGQETPWGPDLKDSAVFTPLMGSLQTAGQYYSGGLWGQSSPIGLSCQKNFVLLATDGKPTSDINGNMYPLSMQQNVYNASTGTWTYSQAAQDVFPMVTNLRSTNYNGSTYDIQTYVVGLGDTVSDPGATAVLNQIANLGGTNSAYFATTASDLQSAFAAISTDIVNKTASDSAVSLNAGSWSSGSNLYQARFNSGGWTGQLVAYQILAGGLLGAPMWDSGQVVNGQDWSSGRRILTYKPSAAPGERGIGFRWPANPTSPAATELDPFEITALDTSPSGAVDGYGQLRLQYLRGSHAYEQGTCPTCTPAFRSRPTSVLGDIIDSAPYYVAAPPFGYSDSLEPAPYSAFVAAHADRTPTIYVGANDGMLHAFSAIDGHEELAYVPSALYANVNLLTGSTYTHRYYADGSPTIGDAFYGGQWHTLLASGLRGGGQGLFALDVTDPTTFAEASASSIVRWEFNDSNDPDLGFTFGQPLIVKTNNGRWSVITGNGYNSTQPDANPSTSGDAFLYVLDAETGALVAKIATVSGTLANPNGLSGAIAIDNDGNGTIDTVYAGDLQGNLWKFNLSSNNPAAWGVAFGTALSPVPLFTDPTHQAITSRPEVTAFSSGGMLVVFGTGRYLDVSDPTTTTPQTFYGIRDTGVPVHGLSNLIEQTVLGTATGADGNTYRVTTHAVAPPTLDALRPGDNIISTANYDSTKSGWYLPLPDTGERDVADPAIRSGRVIFVTMEPNTAACTYGGSGWVMDLDVMTGNRMDNVTFDTNNSGSLSNADLLTYGAGSGTANASGEKIGSIPAAPGFLRLPDTPGQPPYEKKYLNTSSGNVQTVGESAGSQVNHRVSWEQLQ